MARKKKVNYIYALGRRREASARVRLHKGKGESVVNDKPLNDYFPGLVNETLLEQPFKLTGTQGKYYVTVRVVGGGPKGQREAVILGIARTLEKADKTKNRPPLKKAGLLTRDARKIERRKVGTGGKARRKKQSPKR